MEDQAAESNGAGKSALAMSAVWALTGHSDARNEVTAPVRWFSLLATVSQYGLTGQALQCHVTQAQRSSKASCNSVPPHLTQVNLHLPSCSLLLLRLSCPLSN